MANNIQDTVSKKKIIIIDDDPEWQKQANLPLKGKGYDIQFADTYNEALRMLDSQIFDLAIMNVHLSREIRSDWKMFWTNLVGEAQARQTSVIVITAYTQGKDDLLEEVLASYRDTVEAICFKQELTRAGLERMVQQVLARRQSSMGAHPQPSQPHSQARDLAREENDAQLLDVVDPNNLPVPFQPNSILIVTVTKVEARAVLEVFSEAEGRPWTRRAIGNKTYYDLGIHGGAPVFMVQSEMGSATPGGALLTVRQAIQDLCPQAVVMCGVAFGLRPAKQQLGDVLVAKQLLYYESQKADLKLGQIPRGDRITSADRLLDRFRSGDNDWQGAPTHFGLVLSGEKLINALDFRDWLLETEPEAVGGEMEGAGLYAAARDAKVDWILVKAICDWADGQKDDAAQISAARNAAQFVLHVLQLGGWDSPTAHLQRLANTEVKRENEDRSMSQESYVDFVLHVGPEGYVRTVSEEGERQARMSLTIPDDIGLTLDLIEHNNTNEPLLKQLGIRLYQIILPDSIDKHFNQTEAVARRDGRKVRIRLTVEPDTLAQLPWEFAYRTEGNYFLATNPATVLSHYLDLPLPQGYARKRQGPLHILTIVSNPQDQPPLKVDRWDQIVRKALSKPLKEGLLTHKTVKQATFEKIRDALLEQPPDIVQFVGHGVYHEGKGYLALVGENGGTWIVDDERFAAIFADVQDRLGLVCLATCESAKSDSPKSFLGIAPRLVQRGTPAVVAMRYPVLVSTAEIFLDNFYTLLAARKPVDWAVQSARNAIAIKVGLGNREFATPVLFMRAKDGSIF